MRATNTTVTPRIIAVLIFACALVLHMVPVNALTPAHPHASARPALVSHVFSDSDVAITLTSLNAEALNADSALEISATLTNQSNRPLNDLSVDVSLRNSRVTSRAQLAQWEEASGSRTFDGLGTSVRASAPVNLAPGASVDVRLMIPASEMSLSRHAFLWGPRRIALTAREGASVASDTGEPLAASAGPIEPDQTGRLINAGTAVATLRTFLVWQPHDDTPVIDLAYLAPVTVTDSAMLVSAPGVFAEEANSGELADRMAIADIRGVSALIDPALLMPVALPQHTGLVEDALRPQAASDTQVTTGDSASGASDDGAHVDASPGASPWREREDMQQFHARLAELAAAPSSLRTDFAGASLAPASTRSHLVDEGRALHKAPSLTHVEPAMVSAETVHAASAFHDAVLIPAQAVGSVVDPMVSASGFSQLDTPDGTTALVLYDAPLTEIASRAGSSSPPVVSRARFLAETAVIAGQATQARRSILIAPQPHADLDPAATRELMQAADAASWIQEMDATTMLTQATTGDGVRELTGERAASGYLWPGAVTRLHATHTHPNGSVERIGLAPAHAPPPGADAVGEHVSSIVNVRKSLHEPAYANAPLIFAASIFQPTLGQDDAMARIEHSGTITGELRDRVGIEVVSNLNLVAEGAGVPLTIRNNFDTPITVDTSVQPSGRIVQIKEQPGRITLEPHSSAHITVGVKALTSGTVDIRVDVTDVGGALLDSQSSTLSVNPDWENWITVTFAAAMLVLVVIGVYRARRTRSDARAPAEFGPEDLSHVGDPSQTHPSHEESDQHP